MKRLEFHIAYACLNDCIFCSESEQLLKFKDIFLDSEVVEEELQRFSQRGFNHITFTGGEPSLHPELKDILDRAKKLGYTTYLTTNGGLFSSKSFSEKIFPFLDQISFSLHAFSAVEHNRQTKNKESFRRIRLALENFEKTNNKLFGFANIVVTRKNIEFVPEIINFLSRYKKIQQILVSNVAPEGKALKNYGELAVPLGEFKKKIPAIVEARRRKIILRFFGLPICILGKYSRFSNDLCWSSRTTLELERVSGKVKIKETKSYKPVRKRKKVSACFSCAGKNVCGGVFQKYLSLYGSKELAPF